MAGHGVCRSERLIAAWSCPSGAPEQRRRCQRGGDAGHADDVEGVVGHLQRRAGHGVDPASPEPISATAWPALARSTAVRARSSSWPRPLSTTVVPGPKQVAHLGDVLVEPDHETATGQGFCCPWRQEVAGARAEPDQGQPAPRSPPDDRHGSHRGGRLRQRPARHRRRHGAARRPRRRWACPPPRAPPPTGWARPPRPVDPQGRWRAPSRAVRRPRAVPPRQPWRRPSPRRRRTAGESPAAARTSLISRSISSAATLRDAPMPEHQRLRPEDRDTFGRLDHPVGHDDAGGSQCVVRDPVDRHGGSGQTWSSASVTSFTVEHRPGDGGVVALDRPGPSWSSAVMRTRRWQW